jgi:hypothetical protein
MVLTVTGKPRAWAIRDLQTGPQIVLFHVRPVLTASKFIFPPFREKALDSFGLSESFSFPLFLKVLESLSTAPSPHTRDISDHHSWKIKLIHVNLPAKPSALVCSPWFLLFHDSRCVGSHRPAGSSLDELRMIVLLVLEEKQATRKPCIILQ